MTTPPSKEEGPAPSNGGGGTRAAVAYCPACGMPHDVAGMEPGTTFDCHFCSAQVTVPDAAARALDIPGLEKLLKDLPRPGTPGAGRAASRAAQQPSAQQPLPRVATPPAADSEVVADAVPASDTLATGAGEPSDGDDG